MKAYDLRTTPSLIKAAVRFLLKDEPFPVDLEIALLDRGIRPSSVTPNQEH